MGDKKTDTHDKVVVILSITSDIGIALAKRYARDGYKIAGTYHSTNLIGELDGICDCSLFLCDLSNRSSIESFIESCAAFGLKWGTFVSCPCTPLPLSAFFRCNFDEWSDSVHIRQCQTIND